MRVNDREIKDAVAGINVQTNLLKDFRGEVRALILAVEGLSIASRKPVEQKKELEFNGFKIKEWQLVVVAAFSGSLIGGTIVAFLVT